MEDKKNRENKPVFGYILIVLGIIFLFEKIFDFSFFGSLVWDYIWPLAVILLGIFIVSKK